MKRINLLFVTVLIALLAQAQTVSTFNNLSLAADTFWNGSDLSAGFADGNAFFYNVYDTAYGGYWSAGFAYSDMHGNAQAAADTPFTNALEYSAVTGSGYGDTGNYAVAYDDGYGNAKINLTGGAASNAVSGFYVTNSLYTYLSMLHGDEFETAFSYADSDWFELNITGWHGGNPVPDTIHYYLADFRTATSPGIDTNWQWVNLLPLGNVDSLIFSLASSQTGAYGLNTPAYFCMDNFTTTNSSNPGPVAANAIVTINYEQDTLINMLQYVTDSFNVPVTISIISGPQIAGASAIVIGTDSIWYIPTIGVVAEDTLYYSACDIDNQCDTAQLLINVIGFTGIQQIVSMGNKIYPNPFSNSFYVAHSAGTKEIRMYDLQGKLVQDIYCSLTESNTEINAASLSAGTYFIKMISDEGISVAKIIKQ